MSLVACSPYFSAYSSMSYVYPVVSLSLQDILLKYNFPFDKYNHPIKCQMFIRFVKF